MQVVSTAAYFPPVDHEMTGLEDIARHQKHDARYARWCAKVVPESMTKLGSYYFCKDKILRRMCAKTKGQSQIVVPDCLKAGVLRNYHGLPISTHQGRTRTIAQITRRFYWKKMHKDIGAWIKACRVCELRKTPRAANDGGSGVVCKETGPWSTVAMDIVETGSAPTSEGYRYILTAMDIYSRWAITVPLETKKAHEVAEAIMNQILCKLGKPLKFISDLGREFVNAGLAHLCKHWCIEQITTGGYNSQANPVERLHRTIHPAMTMLMKQFGKDWDKYIQVMTFNYNVSTCESTGYSPFELLMMRPQGLLHDIGDDDHEAKDNLLGPTDSSTTRDSLMETMRTAYEHVRSRQAEVATRNQKRLNKGTTKAVNYNCKNDAEDNKGDLVMVWEPQQRHTLEEASSQEGRKHKAPSKWTPKWTGPHRVLERIGGTTKFYFIWHQDQSKKMKMHINRMHLFKNWSEDMPSTSKGLDGTRRYELGGWADKNELIVVPLQPPYNYGIAQIIDAERDGNILYQWWGNSKNNNNADFKPGWKRKTNPPIYYAECKKHHSHVPYLGHLDLKVHQRDILLHGFELTSTNKLTVGIKKALSMDDRVGGK